MSSARTALILTGGGARAGYQAGVLKAIREILPPGSANPFPILCGTNGLEIRLPVPRRDAPESYEDLLEIVVVVRDDSGRLIGVERVSKHQIEARRRKSMMSNAGPWKDWPLEMADKTAIKYAVNRGIIIINDRDAREVMARDEEDSNVVLEAPAAPPKQLAGPDPLEVLDAPARREAVPVDALVQKIKNTACNP
jgi:hypothetical protein